MDLGRFSSLLSIVVINTMTKGNWRREGVISFHTSWSVPHQGESEQELKLIPKGCPQAHLWLPFSHSPDPLHRDMLHCGMDPPTSIGKQENAPTDMITGHSDGSNFSSWCVQSKPKLAITEG